MGRLLYGRDSVRSRDGPAAAFHVLSAPARGDRPGDNFTPMAHLVSELLDASLDDLMADARRLRRGTVVTYSPKVFVPLTTLCRDVCGYCTFARPPRRGERAYMTEEEVLAIARAGVEAGCTEALFTLGDRPEARYRVAREELAALGCGSTSGTSHAARTRLAETGLLPHLNPGVMSRDELEMLRPVAASMGIMLETTAERSAPAAARTGRRPTRSRRGGSRRCGSRASCRSRSRADPDRDRRDPQERIDALLALHSLAEEHGHVREVIVQNFGRSPGRGWPSIRTRPSRSTSGRSRSPGSSSGRTSTCRRPEPRLRRLPLLLDAGIDDWGGVSPVTLDHVNPEAPWPAVDRLREACRSRGLELAPRLPLYPEHVADLDRWADPAVAPAIRRVADADGLAREDHWAPGEPVGVPFVVGRDAAPLELTGDELGEEELVRLFAARGRSASGSSPQPTGSVARCAATT